MESFGEALRRIRKENNLTQEELARKVGMSRSRYAELEKMDGEGIVGKLPALAKTLGCRIDDFFPEMEENMDDDQDDSIDALNLD